MEQVLENDFLSIKVNDHGAELCSLRRLKDNKEYLWQADPQYWGRHAPILFPIVGCLKDGKYIYEGRTYEMSRHGFARDFDFNLIEKEESRIVYMFSSNIRTLEKYPFKFALYVIYELEDNKLTITYKVKNNDDKKIYFSIGAHPAFNCNINEGDKYLKFEEEENLDSYIINKAYGLIEKKKRPILKGTNKLLLTYDLFKEDALVFDNIRSNSITILNDKTDEEIKVSITGFPYIGIWTPEAPFLCIEPWYGIADFVDSNNKLEDKVGIRKLEIGKAFICSYQIEIK